jgi:hypothetical protein
MTREVRCLVAVLTVAAAAAATPAARAAPRVHFGGHTHQGTPIVLDLHHGGRSLDRVRLLAEAKCSDGQPLRFYLTLRLRPHPPTSVSEREHVLSPDTVRDNGRFSATGLGTEAFGTRNGAFQEHVDGRIRRNGAAAGTYRAHIDLVDFNDPLHAVTCTTGRLRWTARSAPGRVYAGTTSQDMPVVVELDADRRSVRHLRFGWGAGCMPDGSGSWLLGDDLVDFPLGGGHFGDAFTEDLALDAGGKRTFAYQVAGSMSRRAASGRLQVQVTDGDAAGTATSTCDTGTITWSARSG